MATLAKMSIYLGLDSSGMTLGVAEAAKQFAKLKEAGDSVFNETRTPFEQFNNKMRNLNDLLRAGAISWDTYKRAVRLANKELSSARWWNRMFSGTASKLLAMTASFVSVEKAVRRLVSGVKAIHDLKLAIDSVDNKAIDNAAAAMERFEQAIDRSAYAASAKLAPSLEVAANNARFFWEGIVGNDGATLFANIVNGIAAQFTNLQSIMSGFASGWVAMIMIAVNEIKEGFAKFLKWMRDNVYRADKYIPKQDQALDKAKNEMKTWKDNLRDAGKMFGDGLSGAAGKAYLKQVEAAADRAKMQADSATKEIDKAAEKAAVKIRDISPPGAFERGSVSAVSAINNVARQEQQRLMQKVDKQIAIGEKQLALMQQVLPGVAIL